MSRKRALVLVIIAGVSLATVNVAAAQMKGMVGGGIGATSTISTPFITGVQMFTVNGIVMLAPNPYLVFVGDLSLGFSPTYDTADASGDVTELDGDSFFIDGMVGLYTSFSEGGFIYGAAGITIGTADLKETDRSGGSIEEIDVDFDTSVGLVFGGGVGFTIVEDLMGYLNIRQRFVTAEAEFRSSTSGLLGVADIAIGGLEMTAGIGFGF